MTRALILAVGSDPEVLESRAAVLRSVGYFVDTANRLTEACNHFRNGDYDAVLLCHSIPASDRDHLAAAIRASGSRVPILLVSPAGEPSGLADATIHSHPEKLLKGIEMALVPVANAGHAIWVRPRQGRAIANDENGSWQRFADIRVPSKNSTDRQDNEPEKRTRQS